nr:hypothetical protein [Geomesophilobacter sediminis]
MLPVAVAATVMSYRHYDNFSVTNATDDGKRKPPEQNPASTPAWREPPMWSLYEQFKRTVEFALETLRQMLRPFGIPFESLSIVFDRFRVKGDFILCS